MQPNSSYYTDLNADVAIWLVAILIVLFGFRYIKDFLVFILGKLYEFFIQHNAGEL